MRRDRIAKCNAQVEASGAARGGSRDGISPSMNERGVDRSSIQPVWSCTDYRCLLWILSTTSTSNRSKGATNRPDGPLAHKNRPSLAADEFPLSIHTFLWAFFMNEVVFGIIIEFRRFVTNIDEPEAYRRGWLHRVIKFRRSESNFMVFKLNFSLISL